MSDYSRRWDEKEEKLQRGLTQLKLRMYARETLRYVYRAERKMTLISIDSPLLKHLKDEYHDLNEKKDNWKREGVLILGVIGYMIKHPEERQGWLDFLKQKINADQDLITYASLIVQLADEDKAKQKVLDEWIPGAY